MRSSPTANEGGTGTAATVADAAGNDGGRFGLGSSGSATGTDGISPDGSKRGNKARDATARFTKGDHSDLIPELLGCDVSRTGYGDWCDAGMACKASGIQFEVWDEWSSKDPRPGMYPGTEKLRRKWEGFTAEQLDGVGSGTLARIISKLGGNIPTYGGGARPRNQPNTTTPHASAPEDPCAQAIAALEAMFRPGDTINVVTECMPKANEPGKFDPVGYGTNVPYGDLRSALEAHVGGGVGGYGDALWEATGRGYDPEAGAWWRVNPTDGHGVKDANVARLGNVLIEADGQPIEEQRRILGELRALGMPIICETDSGKKSVHAIARVDADTSKGRYDERAELRYEFCRVHGLGVDANCKNPSRLTRMPGAMRGKRMQSLLGTYAPGPWKAFCAAALSSKTATNDAEEYPITIRPWAEIVANRTPMSPVLIGTEEEGIVRKRRKLLITAPSKAGKSCLLTELAVAVATGGTWLGFPCARGRVLYLNNEIDGAEFEQRIAKTAHEMGDGECNRELLAANLDVANLRGQTGPLDRLEPRIQEDASQAANKAGSGYSLLIIDPLYKVLIGSENDAKDVADLVNTLDRLVEGLGCTVAYSHHHPKGATGGREAMDRGSGSGVFARDADALIDVSPLFLDEDARAALGGYGPGASAWRASFVERSFKPHPPVDVVFRYPLHVRALGEFSGCRVRGEDVSEERAEVRRERAERGNKNKNAAIGSALAALETEGARATIQAVYDRANWPAFHIPTPTFPTFKRWLGKDGSAWCDYSSIYDGPRGKGAEKVVCARD